MTEAGQVGGFVAGAVSVISGAVSDVAAQVDGTASALTGDVFTEQGVPVDKASFLADGLTTQAQAVSTRRSTTRWPC
jgi:hypothetical protein